MIIITIIAYYAGYKKTDQSIIKSFLFFFDLNQQLNGAMWISVCMWIVTGLSFSMLGIGKSSSIPFSKFNKLFLVFLGSILIILAFEKIFKFHLMVEFRAINLLGLFSESMRKDSPYYWLYYILIPLVLFLILNLFFVYYKLFKGMLPNKKLYKMARNIFIIALLSVPLMILFDIIQGYFWYEGIKHTVFNSIESCWEVIGLTCFIGSNKYIATFYNV
jgi:hypothetical protein